MCYFCGLLLPGESMYLGKVVSSLGLRFLKQLSRSLIACEQSHRLRGPKFSSVEDSCARLWCCLQNFVKQMVLVRQVANYKLEAPQMVQGSQQRSPSPRWADMGADDPWWSIKIHLHVWRMIQWSSDVLFEEAEVEPVQPKSSQHVWSRKAITAHQQPIIWRYMKLMSSWRYTISELSFQQLGCRLKLPPMGWSWW